LLHIKDINCGPFLRKPRGAEHHVVYLGDLNADRPEYILFYGGSSGLWNQVDVCDFFRLAVYLEPAPRRPADENKLVAWEDDRFAVDLRVIQMDARFDDFAYPSGRPIDVYIDLACG
jgi:hypothetical protein